MRSFTMPSLVDPLHFFNAHLDSLVFLVTPLLGLLLWLGSTMVSRMVILIEGIPGTFIGTCFRHPLLFVWQQASFFGTTSRLSRRIFHARDTFMRMREQVAGVLLAVHFRPLGWLWGIGLWLVGSAVFVSVHHQGRRLFSPHNNPSVLHLHSHRDSHCHLLSMKSI